MAPEVENELLGNVALTRRSFVRKAVLGSAFAVPVVASFDMRSIKAEASECLTPNQTYVQDDGTYKFKVIGSNKKHGTATVRVRILDSETGQNISRKGRVVKVAHVYPRPKGVGLKLPKNFKFVNNKTHGRHYLLTLDVHNWDVGFYDLENVVGDDPNSFYIGLYTGDCS